MPSADFNHNEWFASKFLFMGQTYSRRDDIISLVYTLMYLCTQLSDVQAKVSIQMIGKYKIKTSPLEFCKGCPRSELFGPMLKEAHSYKFDQEPHYGKLRFMM